MVDHDRQHRNDINAVCEQLPHTPG
jgi:hypothetical protein